VLACGQRAFARVNCMKSTRQSAAYWLNGCIDTSLASMSQSQIEARGFTNMSEFTQAGATGVFATDDYIGFSFTGMPTTGVPNNYEFAFKGETFTTASDGATGPANQAPTANAGTDQPSVVSGATVTLSGGGSDPNGTLASYKWSRNGGTAGAVTLSPADTALTFIFDLVVTDSLGLASSSDRVTITVQPPLDTIRPMFQSRVLR
jgi:K319-like protein